MMSNSNKKKKVKSNTQIYITFALVCFVSAIVGMIVGGASSYIAFVIKDLTFEVICEALSPACYIVFGAFEVIAGIVGVSLFLKAKKKADAWDGEDEEVIDQIEKDLNYPSMVQAVMMIIGFMSFPTCMLISGYDKQNGSIYGLITLILFVGTMAATISISAMVVNLEKVLNPEKRGNVFELNFRKKWEDSCDEAELITIGKASRKGMTAGGGACLILWLICILLTNFFDGALIGVIAVCIVWLAMQVAYCLECIRLS